jgi:hypothetical protein
VLAMRAARSGLLALAETVTMLLDATGVASTLASSSGALTSSPSAPTTRRATTRVSISRAIVSTSRVGSEDSCGNPSPMRLALSGGTGVIKRSALAWYTFSA